MMPHGPMTTELSALIIFALVAAIFAANVWAYRQRGTLTSEEQQQLNDETRVW